MRSAGLFGSNVLTAQLQPGHDLILEHVQRPDSQDEGVIPQGNEDDSTGQVPEEQSDAREMAPVIADVRQLTASAAAAIAPPAAVSPERDGDVLATALGLAGLLAAQGPQAGKGLRRLDWNVMKRAAGGVLRRLRAAVGSPLK